MKVVLSHPTGNQFVRALIRELSQQGLLSEFHTTVAINPQAQWLKLLPDGIKQELLRRSYPIPASQTHTHPLLELARMTLPKAGFRNAVKHENGWASVDAVYQDIDWRVAARLVKLKELKQADAIYAYEDGALASFKAAKHLGISCLYDLPIGYWRASRLLLKAEQERWPDWAATLTAFRDSENKLQRKDEELRLADQIFVASSFTAKTLSHFPGNLSPVNVVPYGFPPVNGTRSYDTKLSNKRPLRLLFAGGLSQRKGIADLFEAVSIFAGRVTLTVVGQKPGDDCPALNEALARHQWIPSLPHHEILKLMREHDVLVFPSLFEGFGLVITEAMAQGTPVITTDRTAGPDIITHRENGWLMEAGSVERLQEAIEEALLRPDLLPEIGKAAMETARRRPWEVYAQELIAAIVREK